MYEILKSRRSVAGQWVSYYLLVQEDRRLPLQYGVKLAVDSGDFDEVPDITVSEQQICYLLDLLIRNTVTPISLRDILEDWLGQ